MCRKYNRHKSHTDSECYRIKDKDMYNEMNRNAAAKVSRHKHTKQVHIAAMSQVQRLQEDDYIDSVGNTLHLDYNKVEAFNTYMKVLSDKRIIIPIEVQGVKLEALVDPGSTVSIVGEHVMKMLGREISNVNEAVVQYMDDVSASIFCTKDKIELACNGHKLECKTYVLPLVDHD
ncbi:hypothetical protein BGZ76_007607, partial [Entomortierella beljakovae]